MEQSGFLNRHGQAYGYCAVMIENSRYKAPNFFICAWVNGLTLFVPSLVGFPMDLQEIDITAYLYIFDSVGTLIKVYKNSDSFNKLAGLYYGQNPNKKASLLKEAGPITDENMQSGRKKTTEFFKLVKN
jgi:hypothetical protein